MRRIVVPIKNSHLLNLRSVTKKCAKFKLKIGIRQRKNRSERSVLSFIYWLSPTDRFHQGYSISDTARNGIDMGYIEGWAARLGLSSLWQEMLDNVS